MSRHLIGDTYERVYQIPARLSWRQESHRERSSSSVWSQQCPVALYRGATKTMDNQAQSSQTWPAPACNNFCAGDESSRGELGRTTAGHICRCNIDNIAGCWGAHLQCETSVFRLDRPWLLEPSARPARWAASVPDGGWQTAHLDLGCGDRNHRNHGDQRWTAEHHREPPEWREEGAAEIEDKHRTTHNASLHWFWIKRELDLGVWGCVRVGWGWVPLLLEGPGAAGPGRFQWWDRACQAAKFPPRSACQRLPAYDAGSTVSVVQEDNGGMAPKGLTCDPGGSPPTNAGIVQRSLGWILCRAPKQRPE